MAKPPKPKRLYLVFAVRDGKREFLDKTLAVSEKQAKNFVRWRYFGKIPVTKLGFEMVARVALVDNKSQLASRQMPLFPNNNAMML